MWCDLTSVLVLAMVTGGICEPLLSVSNTPHNTLTLDAHRTVHFVHPKGEAHVRWGLTVPENIQGTPCNEGVSCLDFGVARLVVTVEDHCQKIAWTSGRPGSGNGSLEELRDCVLLEGHWYGGGQQTKQPWPIENQPRVEIPFITGDMLQDRDHLYGGVSEAYWVSSQGVAVRVEEKTPLFLSVPDVNGDDTADELCLTARHDSPYAATIDSPLTLTYFLCSADDVRQVHEATFPKFFALPDRLPDFGMIRDPIWSTWAHYHTAVNDSGVLEFARAITAHGFNNSQVEIDDNWETCYGEAVFNPDRFPNPQVMVDQLHSEGFRVTVWVHPFINSDCPAFNLADKHGYLVKDSSGTTQLVRWWNSDKAGLLDFTNAEASAWWTQRLVDLQQQTGIDSFKFDAGESSYLPKDYALEADKQLWPNIYSVKFIEAVRQFGSMIEARVGRGTQRHAAFLRMLDKDSIWDRDNGLKSLIPTLLHFGLLGYPFVLPDMIGGNAYSGQPSKNLFVRWAQANAFMPALQFSLLPWEYDEEVTKMCREVTQLHTQYSPLLLRLAEEAITSVTPMMRPTWWLCPTLEECLTADQQFLVGDDLLAVPVVEFNKDSLNVVLPPGQWKQEGRDPVITGPKSFTLSNITLETIVYFTRIKV